MMSLIKMIEPRQLIMFGLTIIVLFAIIQPLFSYNGLHAGIKMQAHFGGLQGEFNLEGFENETGPMFVMFYSPNCGWCHKMMPDMDALIAQYQTNSKVKVVKIDCVQNAKIAEEHQIQGFPTLRYYPAGLSGSHTDYNGERTTSAMDTFLSSL